MFFLVGRNPDVPLTFFIRAHCNHQTLALYATQRAGEKHLTWLGCKLCLLEMSHQGIAYTWVDQVSVRILTINLSLCIIKKYIYIYIYKYFETLRNMLKYQKPVTWNPQQSPISPEFNGTCFHQLEVGCNIFHTTFKDNFGSWRFVNQDVQVFQVPAGCFPAKHLMERTTPRHAVNQNTRLNYLMFWPLLHYLPTSLSNQFAGIKCNFVPNKETAHSFVSTNPNACRKLSGYCRPQQKLSRFVGKVMPSKLRVKCILGHISSGFNHSLVPSQEVLGSGQTVCEIYIYIYPYKSPSHDPQPYTWVIGINPSVLVVPQRDFNGYWLPDMVCLFKFTKRMVSSDKLYSSWICVLYFCKSGGWKKPTNQRGYVIFDTIHVPVSILVKSKVLTKVRENACLIPRVWIRKFTDMLWALPGCQHFPA